MTNKITLNLELAPGAEAKLKHVSEKSCLMWMQKNTPVPRLNKGISCQEKGDKNCSFEQGGQRGGQV